MFDTKLFGAHLSYLRKNLDLTQTDLADMLNVSRQSVSQYENGDGIPDVTVLIKLSEIFKISLDDLIKSGGPTHAEAVLLKSDSTDEEELKKILNNDITDDIVNIAPYLKPSLLEKIAEGLKKHDIDISDLVKLAEYMNDKSIVMLLENATFETLDEGLLEKLVPFLNDEAKYKIFEKVLKGELNYNFIKIILPYAEYLLTHIEAAVVYGVLDKSVLDILQEYFHNKNS